MALNFGRYTIINENAKLGKESKIWDFCKIHQCKIGENTQIGSYCEIKSGAQIGNNCIIKSYVSICKDTMIGNYVFIGPRVTFLNDKFPTAQKVFKDISELESSVIEDEVTIGGGSIILPGIRIYKGALIGAGSLVTRDVPSFEAWFGNPARFYKKITNSSPTSPP